MESSQSSIEGLGGGETVYVHGSGVPPPPASSRSGGSDDQDSHAVMNDKVQSLAGSVYEEFERMIQKYDRDVVKDLMPLIVNVLENLDLAYTETQELEVEVELLKEDNEQLVTQYEREKQLRKASEQKSLEMDDHFEGERKEMSMKIESLTSIVKMFELKAKNSTDQINRLEEKETEMKKEYTKLHERYTELFKTHIDYMERTKSLLGTDRIEQIQGIGSARNRISGMALNQLNRSSGPVSFGYSELENNNAQQGMVSSVEFSAQTPQERNTSGSLQSELKSPADFSRKPKMVDKGQSTHSPTTSSSTGEQDSTNQQACSTNTVADEKSN